MISTIQSYDTTFLMFLGTIHGGLVAQMRRHEGHQSEEGEFGSSHCSTSWSFSHIYHTELQRVKNILMHALITPVEKYVSGRSMSLIVQEDR
jgi:hypothetical protein